MAAPLTLRLLGGASIEGPDGTVTGRAAQRHRLALLALLAVTPRGMTRDKVVALLWPERESSRARHALSDSIYRINKALAAEVVVAVGERDLRLDREVLSSDVAAFHSALEKEDWERAVEAYGGPFLDGFHVPGSPELERWVDGERRRLAHRYAAALESLAEAREEGGDRTGAAAAWRRRAALDPYDSRVAVRLMEALDAEGNAAAALRHARVHAQLLEQEFDTGPDPDVVAAVERIRNGGGVGSGPAQEARHRAPGAEAGGDAPLPDPHATVQGSVSTSSSAGVLSEAMDSPSSGAPHAPDAGRLWTRLGIGAGAALAAAVAAVWIPDPTPADSGPPRVESRTAAIGPPAEEPVATGGDVSMAVLSFEDLSPEGDREWFAKGIAEEVARTLSEVPGIDVIGPESSFRFGSEPIDLRRIADTLGVEFLVSGTVRAGGDSVWTSADLIDGTTGFYRWNDTYATSSSPKRLRSIQHRIAREVATALALKVADDPETTYDDVSGRAYDAYLEGRAILRRFQSGASEDPEEVLTSLSYFERVVDLEPRWADGWDGLGEAHHWAAYAGFERERHWSESKRALEQALLLDPDHPRANASLGFVLHRLDHDYEAAEARLQRALTLDSEQYWHCGYSFFLLWVGRYEEAVEATRRAEAHNPMSWRREALTVSSERCAGRFEEVIRRAPRVLSEHPGAGGTRRDLALALQRTGRVEEALESLEEARGSHPYLDLVRALVLARSSRLEQADALLRRTDLAQATAWAADWYPVDEVAVAPLHAAALVALDRREAAIEVLQSAMDRNPDTLLYDRCYPELRSLEGDPRYQALLRRTGVPGW